MITYSEFLEQINIIPESEFNEIIESLPDCDINDVEFDSYNCNDDRDIADAVINGILNNWNLAWTDSIDVDNRSFEVYDVECLSDLEEIKETFSEWTISNYEKIKNDLLNDLLEEEKSDEMYKERKEKEGLFNSIIDKISLDDLKKLVNDYKK